MSTFTIVPSGPFSLAAAAGFGFGQRDAAPAQPIMRLAFVVDGLRHHAGVLLRQADDGSVVAEVDSIANLDAVRRQVARILSLDYDGDGWVEVGQRDPVIGGLQELHPGQRPVLFHSAYESAAWCVLSARWSRRQAAAARERIAAAHGTTYELGGETLSAFPLPEQLVDVDEHAGVGDEKVARLRGVAQAALDGVLDTDRLKALSYEDAKAAIQEVRGIGPFYATLVVNRALGHADALPNREPLVLEYAAHYYGRPGTLTPEELAQLAETWRPFRTWAIVLIRLSGDRERLPRPEGPRGRPPR